MQSNGLGGTSDHNVTETAFDAAKCKLYVACMQPRLHAVAMTGCCSPALQLLPLIVMAR